MDKYKTELKQFQESFSQIPKDNDEMLQLESYLFQMLGLNTVEELKGFYIATKRYNIILEEFEKEMYEIFDIDRLKSRLIICFSRELDRKFITNKQ